MTLPILTYLDSNVLVQAATGADRAIQMRALAIITDPNRQFVSSFFSKMEVIPLAIHFGRTKERLFYEKFFSRVQTWIDPEDIYNDAYQLACQHALGTMDAFHLASASFVSAEFVSAEKPTKPLYRAYKHTVSIY